MSQQHETVPAPQFCQRTIDGESRSFFSDSNLRIMTVIDQHEKTIRQNDIDRLEDNLNRTTPSPGYETRSFFETMESLITAYCNLRRYEHAITLSEELMERMKRTTSHSSAAFISASNRLRELRTRVSWLKYGINQYRLVLEVKHPSSATQETSMAEKLYHRGNYLHCLGDWEAAIESLTRALQIVKRIPGCISSLHPIPTMSKLAESYDRLGPTLESFELRREILNVLQRKFGRRPITLVAMYNLAVSQGNLERWKDAIATSIELVQACQIVYGAEHLSTSKAKSLLATVHADAGLVNAAAMVQIQLLKSLQQSLGYGHPDVVQLRVNLGRNYVRLKRARDCLTLHYEWRDNQPPPNFNPPQAFEKLFYTSSSSIELQRKKVEFAKKELSNSPADIAKAQFRLAISYRDERNFKEAQELIVKLDDGIMTEHEGPIIPRTDAIQHMDSFRFMENADDFHQSIQHGQLLLKIARKLFGTDSPEALSEMRNLAVLYRFGGYRREALELFKNVLDCRQSTNGKGHLETLEALQDISDIYCDLELKPELLSVREKLLEITRRELGEETPRTLRAMEQIAVSYADSGRRQESLEILTRMEATRRKPLRLRLPQERERRCDFCYDLNIPKYGSERIDLKKARLNPSDCSTCPIIEQALLFFQPEWKEGSTVCCEFSLINTGQSLLLTDNCSGMGTIYDGIELFVNNGEPVPWSKLDMWKQMRAEASLTGRLSKAKAWIRRCSTEHKFESCSDNHSRPLPKRVLDLRQFRKQKRLFLRPTLFNFGRYACLSYCWGSDAQLCLTEENMQQMYCDIAYDSLSQTHKDAVLVSAALGIPFLWIDALCIIQNQKDQKDWAEQSAEMKEIYGNAYLCIAASHARSAGEGFLSKRNPLEVPQIFRGRSCVVYGRYAFDHSAFTLVDESEYSVNFNSLRERGWCFQEHVLSRRVLHFGGGEMFYECKETANCECGMFPGSLQSLLPENAYGALLYKISTIEKKALNKGWLSFLEEFSVRNFTNPSDRLPSISGIAKLVQSKFGASYLAGHWTGEDLLESLCWDSNDDRHPSPKPDRACYCGPTWSWVSREGGFTQRDWVFQKQCGTEILEASTVLRTSDPTGAVSSGILRIKGVFLNAEVCKDSAPYLNAVVRNGVKCGFWPDYELTFDETESRFTVLCWYIGTATGIDVDEKDIDYISNAQLIVLRQQDESLQPYERIGRGRVLLEEEGFLEGWDQCWNTVTIV